MRKRGYRLLQIAVLLLLAVCLVACKNGRSQKKQASSEEDVAVAQQVSPIVGAWVPVDGDSTSTCYEFLPDGQLKIILSGDHITNAQWLLDGSTLAVGTDDEWQRYEIELSENHLTFLYENGTTAEWTRKK